MKAKRKYKTSAFEAIHRAVEGMHRSGTITKETMRNFDETCFAAPADINPSEIKQLREACQLSQPLFARYLNISESTVEKWETGVNKPSGIALKLLNIIRKHGLEVLR